MASSMFQWTRASLILFVLAYAAGISGCGSSKAVVEEVVWPPPPDEPRIKYIKTFRSEDDFLSGFGKTVQTLAGTTAKLGVERPFDLCTDDRGRLYVSDVEQGLVVFDETRRAVRALGADFPVPLEHTRGIAWGDGKLFVGLGAIGQVAVLDSAERFVQLIGRPGQFASPVDVAYDQVGKRLLIVDNSLHKVVVYSETGDYLMSIGERGEEDGEFNFPQSAAVDNDGNIYVVDAFNFRIQVFDSTGIFLRKHGQQGNAFGMFLRPKGIAIDAYQNIYVVDALHNNFQIFNRNFDMLMFVGRYALDDNRGFLNPVGIHIDRDNRIYVADQVNARVQMFQLLKGD